MQAFNFYTCPNNRDDYIITQNKNGLLQQQQGRIFVVVPKQKDFTKKLDTRMLHTLLKLRIGLLTYFLR